MKLTLAVCLLVLAAATIAVAQNSTTPALRPGMRVQMSMDSHAMEMPDADAEDATVFTITSNGKLFLGVKPVEMTALSDLKTGTVYVKVDARAPFQNVLTVLDALQGRSLVLLTAPLSRPEEGKMMPPYGIKVRLGD